MMPVEHLPSPSWQTALGLGFLSSVFDNIPLTALALKQGGYDWGFLAYAVGFGGSMIWFGSSSGVAISNMYPEARSVGKWLRHGWSIPIAYVVGFFVMLFAWQWHPDKPHTDVAPASTVHGERNRNDRRCYALVVNESQMRAKIDEQPGGIGFGTSAVLFGGGAALLVLATRVVIPRLIVLTKAEPIIVWFVAASLCLFVPLLLAGAWLLASEYRYGRPWSERLRLRLMDKRDWRLALGGLVVIALLSGGAPRGRSR